MVLVSHAAFASSLSLPSSTELRPSAMAACAIASISGSAVAAPFLLAPTQASPAYALLPLCKNSTFCGGTAARLNTSLPVQLHFSPLPIRAASSEETPTEAEVQVDELFNDLKSKWDAVENKSTIFVYGGGALFTLWLSSAVVGALNSVPLIPKVMELIGFGYTGWFVYRYLLFKESRKELVSDIEEIKAKVTGASKDV